MCWPISGLYRHCLCVPHLCLPAFALKVVGSFCQQRLQHSELKRCCRLSSYGGSNSLSYVHRVFQSPAASIAQACSWPLIWCSNSLSYVHCVFQSLAAGALCEQHAGQLLLHCYIIDRIKPCCTDKTNFACKARMQRKKHEASTTELLHSQPDHHSRHMLR